MSSRMPDNGAPSNGNAAPIYSPNTHPDVFPVLTSEELEQCHEFGSVCHFAKGEKIIAVRQPVDACYVILSGEVCIMDITAGKRSCIAQYGTGAFTGDIDLFTGRPAIVDLEAATDLEAICIPKKKIREMMVRNPLLGDKFWSSFQTRREAILRTVFQGLHVYGTKNDRRTLEVIEFLYRNCVPMSWKNIDDKQHYDACIRIANTSSPRYPVISYGEGLVMEAPSLLELADMIGIDHDFSQATYDVIILGAGPAGLGAADVIGGGNSAGQAAMFLSQHAREVTLIVRNDALEKSMSSYLSERVKANPKIKVLLKTQVVEIEGTEHITAVHLKSEHSNNDQNGKGAITHEETSGLFIFIGNKPKTDFLPTELIRDERGYAITGASLIKGGHWHEDRDPEILETSMPGIFAGGDCRAGTTKRVATAIGDGALAVTCITNFLAVSRADLLTSLK